MDKETLSNYGWIVICVLVLAVMIALATPFGNFVADAVKSTAQGLFDVNQSALNSTGLISIGDQSFADGENGGTGDNSAIDHNGATIPDGAYYLYADMTTRTMKRYAEMPATASDGDVYFYGDYMYTYATNYGWCVVLATSDIVDTMPCEESLNIVATDKNQSTYDPILESINGEPVVDMSYTFKQCTSLTTAPAIPSSVINLYCTFSGCTSLTTAPPVIPSSVTNMISTFADTALVGTVSIPCTASTNTVTVPSGATLEIYHFENCGH